MTKKFTGTVSAGTRRYQSFSKASTGPAPWPCLCRDSEGKPKLRAGQPVHGELREGSPAVSSSTVGWVELLAGSRSAVAWGWNPGDGRREASTGCFEGGVAELGWDPAARLAWSPPTAESPQPWRSCYDPSPPVTRRNSPPFGSPADVLWLRLRKITTPLLDTVDIFQWHKKQGRNLPCPYKVRFSMYAQSRVLPG